MKPNFIALFMIDPKSHEILLLQRSEKVYFPKMWQMVTGKIENDENALDAAKREAFEETGLILENVYNVDVSMFYDRYKNQISFSANFLSFVNRDQSITVQENEHSDFKWVSNEEAEKLLVFPSQKETLSFIYRHFLQQTPHAYNRVV